MSIEPEQIKNFLTKQEEEKRKKDFLKRASNGYLLKLYRAHAKTDYFFENENGDLCVEGKTPSSKELELYDAHWTNSLIKNGESISKKKYIKITLGELNDELDFRPHIKSKEEGKKIRRKLAKRKT